MCPHVTHASFGPPESTTQTAFRSVKPFFSQLTADCRRSRSGMSFPVKIAHSHGGSAPSSNTCFLVFTGPSVPNGISIGSAVFAQRTADSPYTTMGAAFPQNCPFPWEIWTPCNTQYMITWANQTHSPNAMSIALCFCTAHRRLSLYFTTDRTFRPENCLFLWGTWTPSNVWFLGSHRVRNPNGISIGSAVFCSAHYCDRQTDRQTDRPSRYTRSVTIGHIYLRIALRCGLITRSG